MALFIMASLLACVRFSGIAVSGSLTERKTVISMYSYADLSYHLGLVSFCQFCGTIMAIHNNSSFVHHEKHCALNLATAVASSILHRHWSIRNVVMKMIQASLL